MSENATRKRYDSKLWIQSSRVREPHVTPWECSPKKDAIQNDEKKKRFGIKEHYRSRISFNNGKSKVQPNQDREKLISEFKKTTTEIHRK